MIKAPLPLPTPPESVSDADSDTYVSPWLKPDIDRSFEKPSTRSRPLNIQLLSTPPTSTPYESFASSSPTPTLPSPISSPAPTRSTTFSRAYIAPNRWRAFLESEPFWLFLYFLFNLGLTLYNKLVLVRFPFPYTLTALHTFAGTIGSYIAMELGYFVSFLLSIYVC